MTPVSDLIGALELSDMRRFDDAALESASGYASVGPTTGCPPNLPPTVLCRRIDDDALESTGLSAGPQPTTPATSCLPPTRMVCFSDDSALENAVEYSMVGPTTGCPPAPTIIMCRRIDDDALESTGLSAGPDPTQAGYPGCR